MLGHYVGDLVLFKNTNVVGVIIEIRKYINLEDTHFKVMWSDGITGLFVLKDIRNFKYALEDKLNESTIS
jgi:hypothetical protein